MNQLLFTVLFAEVAVILILLVKTPLRKLVTLGLDRLKRGRRAPVMVKTIAGTMFIVMMSSIYSMLKIQNRSIEAITPTDQVLMSKHLLEASLIGYSLFLALIIDRLHHYIRELRAMRKHIEASKKHKGNESMKIGDSELKTLKEEVYGKNLKIKQLEEENEMKDGELKAAEANAIALRKQSEGFLLEYDRLLEENQNLKDQLKSIDKKLSHSDGKKNMEETF